jgi:YHS domain-containing protein
MAKIKKKSLEKSKKSFLAWMMVLGVLLIGSYATFMGIMSKPRKHEGKQAGKLTALHPNEKVVDPVCGMEVMPPAEGHIEYRAKHYYFCSILCKEDFEKDPEKYLR